MLRPYISGPLGLGSYAAQPVAQPRFQLLRFVAELQGLADRADVLKHLVERVRVQRDDPRGGHESRDDTRQLAFAHGADVAHRLPDQHVGPQVRHQVDVHLHGRHTSTLRFRHGAVDRARRQRGIDAGAGDARERAHLRREVALVRHADQPTDRPQGGHDLGGGG